METKEFGDGARSRDFVDSPVDDDDDGVRLPLVPVVGGFTNILVVAVSGATALDDGNVATSFDSELGVATDVPLDGKDEEGVAMVFDVVVTVLLDGTDEAVLGTTHFFVSLDNGALVFGALATVPLDGNDEAVVGATITFVFLDKGALAFGAVVADPLDGRDEAVVGTTLLFGCSGVPFAVFMTVVAEAEAPFVSMSGGIWGSASSFIIGFANGDGSAWRRVVIPPFAVEDWIDLGCGASLLLSWVTVAVATVAVDVVILDRFVDVEEVELFDRFLDGMTVVVFVCLVVLGFADTDNDWSKDSPASRRRRNSRNAAKS
jgi:hypothetical protein